MIRRCLLSLVFVVLISPFCFSQKDIIGVWEGKFLLTEYNLGQPKLVVEIHDFKDSLFTGITHLYYKGNQYEHYKMMGWYDKKKGLLVFTEAVTIAVDLGEYNNCLGTYIMSLQKKGDDLYQFGYWEPNINKCSSVSNIWLRKRIEEVKKVPEPEKKTATPQQPVVKNKPVDPAKPLDKKKVQPQEEVTAQLPAVKNNPSIKIKPSIVPAKISQRETDVQSLLEIAPADKDSIKVEVYDNGEIDGDSVSVYEEQTVRVDRKMITAKPITFYVSLDKDVNPIAHLRLVAESLGSIPPCTALMIVTTKSKRYEVRLSSNFSKNATVELFLKE